jgi:nicotinamide mononucleotide (NMN) deamidase PncC
VQKREDGSPSGSLEERPSGDVYLSTFYSSKEVKRLKRRFSMYFGSLRYSFFDRCGRIAELNSSY